MTRTSTGVRKLEASSIVAAEDVRDLLLGTISEKEWRQTVVDKAVLFGWRCYWVWNSKHSPKGWLDLEMLRPPRFIKAELKTMTGTLTREQRETLELLSQYAWIEAYVWRPSDYDAILEVLR